MALQLATRPSTGVGIHRPSGRAVSLFGAVTASTIFVAMGLALVALAAAFPLALASVELHDLRVPTAELRLAESIAPLWWLFIVAAVAHFAAGFAAPDGRALGKGAAVTVAAIGVILTAGGTATLRLHDETAIVAGVVIALYLVALAGSALVRRSTD